MSYTRSQINDPSLEFQGRAIILFGKNSAKRKHNLKFLLPMVITLIFMCQCEKSITPLSYNAIDLQVYLKDNLAYINWKFNDSSDITSYGLGRLYSSKKENYSCDTCSILSENEFINNFIVYQGESCFISNDLNLNTYIDSTFSYSDGLFYHLGTNGDSIKTSNYVKLVLPELPYIETVPYKVTIDSDLNLLILLDISSKVKIISYDLAKNIIVNTFEFDIDGNNIVPKPDMCTGVYNGNKKLFFSMGEEIYVFDLANLVLEWTFHLDSYLDAITYDNSNNIYTCDIYGKLFKISYSDKTISNINSEIFYIVFNYEMRILNNYLFFFTVNCTGPKIIKYQIQNDGNLVKIAERSFSNFILRDIDYCTSKSLFVLSNGYMLDMDLNLYHDLSLSNSDNIFAITDNSSKIAFNIPSTKEIIYYDITTGISIGKKRLLSYPLFLKSSNQKNICIGKFGNKVCIESF